MVRARLNGRDVARATLAKAVAAAVCTIAVSGAQAVAQASFPWPPVPAYGGATYANPAEAPLLNWTFEPPVLPDVDEPYPVFQLNPDCDGLTWGTVNLDENGNVAPADGCRTTVWDRTTTGGLIWAFEETPKPIDWGATHYGTVFDPATGAFRFVRPEPTTTSITEDLLFQQWPIEDWPEWDGDRAVFNIDDWTFADGEDRRRYVEQEPLDYYNYVQQLVSDEFRRIYQAPTGQFFRAELIDTAAYVAGANANCAFAVMMIEPQEWGGGVSVEPSRYELQQIGVTRHMGEVVWGNGGGPLATVGVLYAGAGIYGPSRTLGETGGLPETPRVPRYGRVPGDTFVLCGNPPGGMPVLAQVRATGSTPALGRNCPPPCPPDVCPSEEPPPPCQVALARSQPLEPGFTLNARGEPEPPAFQMTAALTGGMEGTAKCSGIAINTRTIVTAAHCVCAEGGISGVQLTNELAPNAQISAGLSFTRPKFFYPEFCHLTDDEQRNFVDLALLFTNEMDIDPSHFMGFSAQAADLRAPKTWVAGFGMSTQERQGGLKIWADLPRERSPVEVCLLPEHEEDMGCRRNRELFIQNLGETRRDTCPGDSGGPLMIWSDELQYFVVIGMTVGALRGNTERCGAGGVYLDFTRPDLVFWIFANADWGGDR